jgi:outer membrane protein
MRKLALLAVLGLITFISHAQTATTKVGYADVDYIFSQMPESKQIDSEQANINNMIDAVRANTERELVQMQQNIEKLQQDAQTTVQTKQTTLMDPVFKKVGKAIEDVAKENSFTFILSQQIGGLDVILYGDEKMDVSDLVLKKLGVTPKPAAPAPAPK